MQAALLVQPTGLPYCGEAKGPVDVRHAGPPLRTGGALMFTVAYAPLLMRMSPGQVVVEVQSGPPQAAPTLPKLKVELLGSFWKRLISPTMRVLLVPSVTAAIE